jgi:EpsD family peptidyl-prolyl cis-trans isomerase
MPSLLAPCRRHLFLLGTITAAAIAFTGCGDAKAPKPSQVAARVNSSEISVHQVNYAVQRSPGAAANPGDALTRQVVERLVMQQLAVDKAEELKLDLVPETQQALQEARRGVLARAYFDRVAAGLPKPDATEIDAFYDKRPELFAQRRKYSFQELDIEASGEQLEALKKRLGEMPVPAFVNLLRERGVRYTSRLVNEPAENLSLDLIGRLGEMAEGQSIYLTRPSGLKVLLLVSAQPAPVSRREANAAIARFLSNERSRDAVEKDLNAMRTAAKVEYIGRFAELMAPANALAAPGAAAAASAAGTGPEAPAPSHKASEPR